MKKLKFLVLSSIVTLILSVSQKILGMEEDAFAIVEKVYNPNITYNPGIFNGGSEFSTPPCQPQKEWKKNSLIYTKKSEEFTSEAVLMKVISGENGRQNIPNTTKWPYSIHAQLSMTFKGDNYGGSGSMVGPHHLLTCGHCVYNFDKKFFFEEISVYPALNGEIAPFGKVKVTKAYIFKLWQNEGNQKFDMALLLLDERIGDYTGWGGLLSISDKEFSEEKVHITGYPEDKSFKTMWSMSHTIKTMWSMSHTIKTIQPEQFEYEIDTYERQRGSAIWINKWGMPMIAGVHTIGENSINSGVRLSERKFEKIIECISKTFILPTDVNDTLLTFNFLNINPFKRLPSSQNEQIYERFLKGILIYRPNKGSNQGMITLPIAKLTNPLEGTFDLSQCGDTGKHLSISTGYRKGKKGENENKVEIWFTPRFLVEKELQGSALHFQGIFPYNWSETSPVGILWTHGYWNNLLYFDYLTTQSMDDISNDNLYKKWSSALGPNVYNTWPVSSNHPMIATKPFWGGEIRHPSDSFHIHFAN